MQHVLVYGAMGIVFLALDAVMLSQVMKPLFERNLGEALLDSPRYGPAAVFYLFFVFGLWFFAVRPAMAEDSLWTAVWLGAFIGALGYGTYEFTNLATLRDWSWQMVITDFTWGAVLSGVTAGAGLLVARALGLVAAA